MLMQLKKTFSNLIHLALVPIICTNMSLPLFQMSPLSNFQDIQVSMYRL